jgi:glycogen operon protein
MTEEEWHAGWVRCLGMRLSGRTLDDVDWTGSQLIDDTYLICMNPHQERIQFFMPPSGSSTGWEAILDTGRPEQQATSLPIALGTPYELLEHSAVILREAAVENAHS